MTKYFDPQFSYEQRAQKNILKKDKVKMKNFKEIKNGLFEGVIENCFYRNIEVKGTYGKEQDPILFFWDNVENERVVRRVAVEWETGKIIKEFSPII